jgi:hypothetical protein
VPIDGADPGRDGPATDADPPPDGALGDVAPGDMTASDMTPRDAGPGPDGVIAPITWRDTRTQFNEQRNTNLALDVPPGVLEGDFMLVVFHAGWSGATEPPTYTAPPGWTLHRRTDRGAVASLLVYWKRAGAAEPSKYTWTASFGVFSAGWMSVYSGVSSQAPIDVDDVLVKDMPADSYSTPSITTTGPGELIIATFSAYDETSGNVPVSWSTPPPLVVRANLDNNQQGRSLASGETHKDLPGSIGPFTASVSGSTHYGITHLIALRPGN